MMKVVDLFCGAGGLSLGFQQAGIAPVFAADCDEYACATYRANLGDHVHCLDLAKISADELRMRVEAADTVDIVAGGPPCQGFSIQRRGQQYDPRNDLVVKFGDFALALRPKAIVLENVPTILGPRGRAYLQPIIQRWTDAGYRVHQTILEAAAYGVPQMRRRAFVVAVRSEYIFEFPEPQLRRDQYATVRQAIGDLPSPPPDFSDHPNFRNHKRVAVSEINIRRFSFVPEGGGRVDVPSELQLPCHRKSNGHRHLDVFGRLWWDRPSGTITAMFDNFTRGRFGHPSEDRNITAREGARLQSFPDDFVFVGPKKDVARQIGNAVCPKLAYTLGEALLYSLGQSVRPNKQFRQSMLPL